jgi:predicted transcriptional regulator
METATGQGTDLDERVHAIAARSTLSPPDVIADALLHGRSLAWQEHFIDVVSARLAEADQGDFANTAERQRVLNKYRPSCWKLPGPSAR